MVFGDEGELYGKPLTGTDTVKISALMADPDKYVGQTVRVEGIITGVCEKRGCWMTLASDREFEDLRIKVDDGVIVFPLDAKGKRAVAEGRADALPETVLAMAQARIEALSESERRVLRAASVFGASFWQGS